jgi:hypothetical protein
MSRLTAHQAKADIARKIIPVGREPKALAVRQRDASLRLGMSTNPRPLLFTPRRESTSNQRDGVAGVLVHKIPTRDPTRHLGPDMLILILRILTLTGRIANPTEMTP